MLPVKSSSLFAAENRNGLSNTPLSSPSLSAEISPRLTLRSEKGHSVAPVRPSHHKLGHLVIGQVQREVLVGSFDGEWVLVTKHTGALLAHTLVPAAVAQLLGAAERVAVSRVLAKLRPLQTVLLVEPDVVQRLAVTVSGVRLPAD